MIRAIASSTACSGLMPSAATRWTASPSVFLYRSWHAASRPRQPQVVGAAARVGAASPSACGAGRSVQPEWRIEQLRNRWQHALAGEVEIVRQPALADQEAHELLGGATLLAVLEDHSAIDNVSMANCWPSGAERPFDRRGVLVVVLGPLALERVGDRERLVRRHHDGLREELLVVAVGVPRHRVGRGAALAVDRRVAGDRLDESAPDLRSSMTRRPSGSRSRPRRRRGTGRTRFGVDRGGRHGEADAPDVVAAEGLRTAGCTSSHQKDQKASHSFGMSSSVKPACSSRFFHTWTWLVAAPSAARTGPLAGLPVEQGHRSSASGSNRSEKWPTASVRSTSRPS